MMINKLYKIILGAIVILPVALFSTLMAIPVTTVFAFSDNTPPPQSCSPAGLEHSSTGQNPNCFGGKIPNCVSNGNGDGSSGCRNQGTCSKPQASNRPFHSTPSCSD